MNTKHYLSALVLSIILGVVVVGQSLFSNPSGNHSDAISFLPTGRTQVAALSGAGSGLVGWWKFDEGSGTMAGDSSGSGNSGTLSSGVVWTTGVTGSTNTAVGMSNTSSTFVSVPDSASLQSNTVTVSAWVKLVAGQNTMIVAKNHNGPVFAYYLRDQDGYIDFGSSNGFQKISDANYTGVWVHITGVYDGNVYRLYINGSLAGTSVSNTAPLDYSGNLQLYIGGYSGSYMSTASIDDVRIYNRPLSAAEVSSLYSENTSIGSAPTPPTPPINSNETTNSIVVEPVTPSTSNTTYNYSVTVSKSGTGFGTVTGGNINCGSTCSQSVSSGSLLTLTASPSTGSVFAGWSGGGCSGTASCYMTPSTDMSVTAMFNVNTVTNSKTHWVSPNGAETWANCASDTSITGTTACSLSTANQNARAGDTVYLHGGTYLLTKQGQSGVGPINSGTGITNRIIFAAAPGEVPIIKGGGCYDCGIGLDLAHRNSYIKIDGITFENLGRWAFLTNYSNHNEVTNSVFRSDTGEDVTMAFFIGGWCSGGSDLSCYSTHNWIHNNVFSKAHRDSSDPTSCYEGRDLVRVGDGPNPAYPPYTGDNNYNTIENNYLEYAGHTLFENYGMYTVFRNNVLNNNAWIPDTSGGNCWYPPMPSGLYGHRGMQLTEDFGRPATYVLLEGNRVGYSSANPNNPGEANISVAAPRNIIRYNSVYGSQQAGFFFKYVTNGQPGSGGMGSTDNRVYNNTAYHNGWSYPFIQQYQSSYNGHTCSTCPGKLGAFTAQQGTAKNVLKNNIAYDSSGYYLSLPNLYPGNLYTGLDINVASGLNPSNFPTEFTLVNNWTTASGNPNFSNPSLSDPTSRTLPDLSLKSTSPAVDKGTYLTTTINSGSNSTSLTVADALYFQDGSWGSDLVRQIGNFQGDWIAIGTISNTAQIISVNYSNNSIVLRTPLTWSSGAAVWLYKDSQNKQVLYGSAPDMGASEYVGSGSIVSNSPTIVVATTTNSSSVTNTTTTTSVTSNTQTNLNTSVSNGTTSSIYEVQVKNRLPVGYRFSTPLKLGMTSIDVKYLQIFLNDRGFTVSKSGNGSYGKETTYFGPSTYKALISFQNANATTILYPYQLTKGTGYFGPSTIKVVNQMLGK